MTSAFVVKLSVKVVSACDFTQMCVWISLQVRSQRFYDSPRKAMPLTALPATPESCAGDKARVRTSCTDTRRWKGLTYHHALNNPYSGCCSVWVDRADADLTVLALVGILDEARAQRS